MSTARDHQRQQVAAVVARYARVFCWLLHRFASAVMNTTPDSHQKGMAWQSQFARIARNRGLVVEPGTGRSDLVVTGKRVQCKNIDSVRGRMIDISNMRPVKANDGHRGYLAHELDVLALLHCGKIFLIPRDSICDERGVIAGKVSTSFIAQFQDNWGVFDVTYVPPKRDRQQDFL
jgi:hypothetical protein